MSLTFGQAKEILAQYQGKGGKAPTNEALNLFTLKVLQYLLITGNPNCERLFSFHAVNGTFTAPYELEVPMKVRIDGRVGSVVNRWFEFQGGEGNLSKALEAQDVLLEDPNTYFTAFDLPAGGAFIGVKGTTTEDPEAHIIISGDDPTGREIFTNHKGAQISGELLHIRRDCITWTNVKFGNVIGIVKSRTNGYTPLYWKQSEGLQGFLADYSPVEEVPSYRRFRINIPTCPRPVAKITVLGRVRLKPNYADSDRIPFDNILAIEIAGQAVNKAYNDDDDAAAKKDTFLQNITGRETVYKKVNTGQPIDVFYPLSAGTIKGIVGDK